MSDSRVKAQSELRSLSRQQVEAELTEPLAATLVGREVLRLMEKYVQRFRAVRDASIVSEIETEGLEHWAPIELVALRKANEIIRDAQLALKLQTLFDTQDEGHSESDNARN